MRLIQLQDEYLRYLATQRGCAASTLRTYGSAFRRCLRASAADGYPDPDTEALDRRWASRIVQRLGSELRPRTVHRNITAWRAMLAYARQQGYTAADPFAGVILPKKDAVDRTPVTTDDIQALLLATDKLLNRTRAAMLHALILTAATAATRYSDLIPLRIADVDLAAGTIFIRRGKGNKSRTIPVPKETVAALRHWVAVRRSWLDTRETNRSGERPTGNPSSGSCPEPDALWLADRGRRLGEDGLRKCMRELCLIAGIDRRIGLHDIRHSAATRMARQGMPLVGIQAVLGHSSLSTTQTYIAGCGPHLEQWAERMALSYQPDTPKPGTGRPAQARFPVHARATRRAPRARGR